MTGPEVAADDALRRRATRATLWTLVGFGGQQGLRLISNLILTRLLFTEAFGLMALVSVLLQGLAMFSDVGIMPSLIRHERGEVREFRDTAFTMQAARGIALWLVACLGAAPAARFYEIPELELFIPICGFTTVLAGLNSTKLHTAKRHLHLGRLAVLELASQGVASVGMVVWALFDRSVWALVAGGILHPLVRMLLSHFYLPGEQDRLHWNREDAATLFRFGRWIFIGTALAFMADQTDRLIFGKLLTLHELGVYNIALMIGSMAMLSMSHIASQVLFPLLSAANRQGNLAEAYRRGRWPLLLAAGWLLSGFIAGGPVVIDILYDERYADAGWMLQFFAVGSWVSLMEYCANQALLARGLSQWNAAAQAAKFAGVVVLLPLGHALGGVPGALLGIIGAELLKLAVSTLGIVRQGLLSAGQDLALLGLGAAAIAAGMGGVHAVRSYAGGHVFVSAVVVFVAVTAVWLAPGLRVYRRWRAQRTLSAAA